MHFPTQHLLTVGLLRKLNMHTHALTHIHTNTRGFVGEAV